MPNSKWDDDKIENLLWDFPEIRDERPKEDVYNRLAKKEPARKQPKRWMPYLAAALAFITVAVLITSLLNQNVINTAQNEESSTEESANHSTAIGESSDEAASEAEILEDKGAEDSSEFSAMKIVEPATSSVYADDLEGFTLFTIGLTENAYVVPVSYLIPDEQIVEDFGSTDPDAAELYSQYANEVNEEALGFDDYHPYEGNFEKTADGIDHRLPESHAYDLASAAIGVYTETLKSTFQGEGQISVLNEDGSPAKFNQVGPFEPFEATVEKLAYYSYTTAAGETYLVPEFSSPHVSASEAIEAMKNSPNDFLQTAIPPEIDFSVSEADGIVEIQFSKPLDFQTFDQQSGTRMIEAMALTAESFGKTIKFSNAGADHWNGFDFTKPIPTPEAPNRMEWDEN